MPDSGTGLVKAGNIPCKGNGISLGFTDGTNNYSPSFSSHQDGSMDYNTLGSAVGKSTSSYRNTRKTIGIVTDPTKSGIIADTSSLTLSCRMIIKI